MHVVEVVTGYVQSNILRDGLQHEVDSLYMPIRAHMEKLKNDGNRTGMPASTYAKNVIDKITRKSPAPEIWEGARAWQLYFVTTWLPTWISVSFPFRRYRCHTQAIGTIHIDIFEANREQYAIFFRAFRLNALYSRRSLGK